MQIETNVLASNRGKLLASYSETLRDGKDRRRGKGRKEGMKRIKRRVSGASKMKSMGMKIGMNRKVLLTMMLTQSNW